MHIVFVSAEYSFRIIFESPVDDGNEPQLVVYGRPGGQPAHVYGRHGGRPAHVYGRHGDRPTHVYGRPGGRPAQVYGRPGGRPAHVVNQMFAANVRAIIFKMLIH